MSDNSIENYDMIALNYIESDPENGIGNFRVYDSYFGLPEILFDDPWCDPELVGEDPRQKDPNTKEEEYYSVEIVRTGTKDLNLDQDWTVVFNVGSPDIVFVRYHCD
jgi:hypothetical protein